MDATYQAMAVSEAIGRLNNRYRMGYSTAVRRFPQQRDACLIKRIPKRQPLFAGTLGHILVQRRCRND